MKQIYVYWIACCLLFVFPTKGQLLWKVTGNGIGHPSYLYGTIHMMPEENFVMRDNIIKAFNSCEELAMEIDLNMDFKSKIQMAGEMILPQGITLKNLMDSSAYKRLKSYCMDSLHIRKRKFRKYEKLKPFFFSALIMKEKMGKSVSYEEEFLKMARKQSKKSFGLESVQDQIRAINTVSLEDQAGMLIEELFSVDQSFADMLDLYLREDIEGIQKMVAGTSADVPGFEYNFLESRNSNWIPVIEKNIATRPVFIAIGAAHLPGNKGLIQLLQHKGYTVEAVR